MIVECPQCAKRYRLGEDSAADGRRKLRCTACGTVFAAAGREAPAPGAPPPPAARPAGGAAKRILVCDDAPFFRSMLSDVLTEAGFVVETAGGGEEALASISASRPDLLVLDLQMPGMDGFEVIRKIRGAEGGSGLPILAVSGVFTDSSDMMELQDAGADDYIGKQFKPEQLLKRVRVLLGIPYGET